MKNLEKSIMRVHFKKLKLFIHLGLFMFFSGISFLMLVSGYIVLVVMGLIGIVYFIPFTIFLFYRLISQNPAVLVTEEGIYHNISFAGTIFIGWSEIDKISMYEQSVPKRFKKIKCLLIYPKNTNDFLKKLTGTQKIFRYVLKPITLSISEYLIKAKIVNLNKVINRTLEEKKNIRYNSDKNFT